MNPESLVKLEAVQRALEEVNESPLNIEIVMRLLANDVVDVVGAAPEGEEESPPSSENEDPSEPEDDKPPKVKQQYVMLVSDPNHQITEDLVGYVLTIPEDNDLATVVGDVKKAAYNFNASKKGRKYPVNTIGSAIGVVSSKFFKPYDIKVKTKEPVYIVRTDDKLPRE